MLIPIDFKVCVHCFTYNHAQYITDTLDGFTKQVTDFPFVCVILDDCSTDKTAGVLADYLDNCFRIVGERKSCEDNDNYRLSFARHIKNENCYFAVYFLKYNHYTAMKPKAPYFDLWDTHSKCVAMCEGDDYWTDPKKLQKQVVFMDANPDYTLCFHAVYEKYEGNPRLNKIRAKIDNREYSGIEWYKNRPSQTASFLFRSWVLFDPFYKGIVNNRRFIAGDIPLLLSCAHLGKIRGMSDVMSVYRHNKTGWTQKKRTKDELLRIADSQLEYRVFGKEFEPLAITYYNRECVKAFIYSFKEKPDFSYLQLSLKTTKWGTVKAFFSVILSIVKNNIRV